MLAAPRGGGIHAADSGANVSDMAQDESGSSSEASGLDQNTFDLSPKNPNAPEEAPLRAPEEILEEIAALDVETTQLLATVRGLL